MFNIMNAPLPEKSAANPCIGWCIAAIATVAAAFMFAHTAAAQQPVAADADVIYIDNDEFLEDVVGRIALYPDPLVAIVLPASTYPLQIVQAARFLEEYEQNPALQPNPDWDDSVIALLNYPEVLAMMNEDLDWTWTLGDAVLYDQNEVLAAIQDFRDRAYLAGNLRSDEHQLVNRNDTVIEVVPVQPDVIYVPYYEPRRVVYYQPAPVIWYYPRAYPVYYYPYPVGYLFPTRYFWGVTTVFSIGWRTRLVHVHHHHYSGHPFFGYHYHVPYYVRAPRTVTNVNIYIDNRRGDVWQPSYRGGSRPQSVSVRDSDRRNIGQYTDRRTDTARPRSSGTMATTAGSNRINERFDARVASRSSTESASRRSGRTPEVTTATPAAREARRSEAAPGTASAATPRTSDRPAAGRADRSAATRAPDAGAAQRALPRNDQAQGNAVQRNPNQRAERAPATPQRAAPRTPAPQAAAPRQTAPATAPRTAARTGTSTAPNSGSSATGNTVSRGNIGQNRSTVTPSTPPATPGASRPVTSPGAAPSRGTMPAQDTVRTAPAGAPTRAATAPSTRPAPAAGSTVTRSAPAAPAAGSAPATRVAPSTAPSPATRAAPSTAAPSTNRANPSNRAAQAPSRPAPAPAARSGRSTAEVTSSGRAAAADRRSR
jgi:hypothetical protein